MIDKKEMKMRINDRKNNIEKLYLLSPEIEERQAEISRFFLRYPSIIGISYPGAEILLREKDPQICMKAIKLVADELSIRRDTSRKDFCFVRRSLSENQIRKIIQRLKAENMPTVKKNHVSNPNTRSEVLSLRTDVATEDAITFLANACSLSKSSVVDILIKIQQRYGHKLKR